MRQFLFVFCLLCIYFSAAAQADSIYTQTDTPPLFDGCNDPLISAKQRVDCSQMEMAKFIAQNIVYPDSAKAHNTEGIVLLRFVVQADGTISQTELLRDIGDLCGREALRVVRLMPNFTPAEKDGKAVACYMTLPIRFTAVLQSEFSTEQDYSLHWGNIYDNKITLATFKNLLEQSIEVRDHYGNTYPIRDIEMTLILGYDVRTEKAFATVKPSSRMRRKFKNPLVGTTIVLQIQADHTSKHERIKLMREYEIID